MQTRPATSMCFLNSARPNTWKSEKTFQLFTPLQLKQTGIFQKSMSKDNNTLISNLNSISNSQDAIKIGRPRTTANSPKNEFYNKKVNTKSIEMICKKKGPIAAIHQLKRSMSPQLLSVTNLVRNIKCNYLLSQNKIA